MTPPTPMSPPTSTAGPAPCLVRVPRPDARLRLFCFHHAGGGASFFAPWPARVPPGVDVVPVQLPGRESRFGEPRFRDLWALADELAGQLDPWMDHPHAVYGHSMGALVAYTLVGARLRAGRRPPLTLFVGACAAPHLAPPVPAADACPDDVLARHLVGIGGLDREFLGKPEWLSALLPVVRDDLRLCASAAKAGISPGGPLPPPPPLPVQAFAGEDDPLVPEWAVPAWERYSERFRFDLVPGGHFFPRDSPAPFFAELNRSLTALLT